MVAERGSDRRIAKSNPTAYSQNKTVAPRRALLLTIHRRPLRPAPRLTSSTTYFQTMGSETSKAAATTDTSATLTKNSGTVNNEITISDSVQIHNNEFYIIFVVIAICQVLQVIYLAYRIHSRRLKKKYTPTSNP